MLMILPEAVAAEEVYLRAYSKKANPLGYINHRVQKEVILKPISFYLPVTAQRAKSKMPLI